MAGSCAWTVCRRTAQEAGALRLLFDTSVLISHLRGDERATELLLSVPTARRMVSVLSGVELEGGMRAAEKGHVARLLNSVQLIPVTEIIAGRAGQFLRQYRRSHAGIDLVDYVIAATADVHAVQLQTLNVKHFPMFGSLQPPF